MWKDDKVSKEKYEKLLTKYKALVEKNTPSQRVGELSNGSSDPLLESKQVDAFRKSLIESEAKAAINSSNSYNSKRVRKDISLLYQEIGRAHV